MRLILEGEYLEDTETLEVDRVEIIPEGDLPLPERVEVEGYGLVVRREMTLPEKVKYTNTKRVLIGGR